MSTQILITIIAISFIHWFADFVCQSDEDAKGKSKDWSNLLSHTSTYSLIWFICIFAVNMISWRIINDAYLPDRMYWFPVITFLCHTPTDYYTSRVNSGLLPKRIPHGTDLEYFKEEGGSIHQFFVSVGFDQFLHYSQLFITYYLLIK